MTVGAGGGVREVIAGGAARGARAFLDLARERLGTALERHQASTPLEFPNTAYSLPVIYAVTGRAVQTLQDAVWVMDEAERMIPPPPADALWLPYLGDTLDAGMAALWLMEVIEALRYLGVGLAPVDGLWLGAADDVIMRARGVEFVDGSAPGFAAVTGAAPSAEAAAALAPGFAGVLFDVQLVDAHPAGVALRHGQFQVAAHRQGTIVLRNLVALGQVRVEIVLAGKVRDGLNFGVHGRRQQRRLFHHGAVQYRQNPRQAGAYRADVTVRRFQPRIGLARTEDLGGGIQLDVSLKPDHGFVFGHSPSFLTFKLLKFTLCFS